SLGNQEKWFEPDKNLWYKVDGSRFEALAEAVAGEILREHTNVTQLPGMQVAKYWGERGTVHKRDSVLSVSENFRGSDDSIVTINTILRNAVGKNYAMEFNRRACLKERMKYLVDVVEKSTGMVDFGAYMAILFEIDALILNKDQHLNNIAVMNTNAGYKPCPIFDNGASFLLDMGLYRFDVETKSYIAQARALPFRVSFTRCAHVARELYGAHLQVDFSKGRVEQIAEKHLKYYPQQFAPYLKERVVSVLMTQSAKLFRR
ncbi:MAG: hypothetical protein RR900_07900, partial [Ruthenibacterium sp.]